MDHPVQDGVCAAHACLDRNGPPGAVGLAGATFHAGIPIENHRFAVVHLEYLVGADVQALAASGAFMGVKCQGGRVLQVFHVRPSSENPKIWCRHRNRN